MHLRI